jgi:hypothetical protein
MSYRWRRRRDRERVEKGQRFHWRRAAAGWTMSSGSICSVREERSRASPWHSREMEEGVEEVWGACLRRQGGCRARGHGRQSSTRIGSSGRRTGQQGNDKERRRAAPDCAGRRDGATGERIWQGRSGCSSWLLSVDVRNVLDKMRAYRARSSTDERERYKGD